MEDVIPLSAVLKELSKKDKDGNKVPFSILFRTFQLSSFTPGREKTIKRGVMCGNRHGMNKTTIGIKSASGTHPYTCVIPLIFMVNGKRVIA